MNLALIERVRSAWEELTHTPLLYTPADAPPPDAAWRIPLEHDGESLGWLSVERPAADLTESEMVGWLTLCAQLLAEALGERNVAGGLADEVLTSWNQQSFLYEILKVNAARASIEDIAEKISALAQGIFRCENAFLAFRDGSRQVYRSARSLVVERVDEYFDLLVHTPVLTLNDSAPTFLGVRVPLTTAGEAILGMLGAEQGEFKARDRQLAESLAEQIGTVLDNLALQRQRTASLRLEQELEIAAQIQSSLLPARLPQLAGFDLAGVVVPAYQVGGDFYDVVDLGEDGLAILMGDVAGKGIPAAMLTTLIRAELRGQVLGGASPGTAIARANANLEPDLNRLDTFATALVARLQPYQQRLIFASAGHTASFYWRAALQSAEELLSTTLPLGIFQESLQAEQSVILRPGDLLVFYSDGVTEALGPDGSIFGWSGLKEVLQAVHTASAETIVQAVLQATDLHRRGRPLSDDLTLLVLKHDRPSGLKAQRSFVFPVEMSCLRQLDGVLHTVLGEAAPNPDMGDWQIEYHLAMTEHVSNIMRHAYGLHTQGRIYGLLSRHADRIVLETVDLGRPFDPKNWPEKPRHYTRWQDLPEGGFGLPLIRAVMDEMYYERRSAGGNYWRLERKLP
jgi:serine phosphatase RsbU (regulator of sigma subunit)/anti-sigma regulatory factor (Ser/Thr protein kinase)